MRTPQKGNMGIDASAALAFALQDDPHHVQAVSLVAALDRRNITLCAPPMFAYEVDSVLRLREWKGELTPTQVEEARTLIDALGVEIEYDAADRERALEIARQYDQPRAYDAAYAAHAEARGVELVTTDQPFYEALNGKKKPKAAPALSWVKLLNSGF